MRKASTRRTTRRPGLTPEPVVYLIAAAFHFASAAVVRAERLVEVSR